MQDHITIKAGCANDDGIYFQFIIFDWRSFSKLENDTSFDETSWFNQNLIWKKYLNQMLTIFLIFSMLLSLQSTVFGSIIYSSALYKPKNGCVALKWTFWIFRSFGQNFRLQIIKKIKLSASSTFFLIKGEKNLIWQNLGAFGSWP